MVWQAFPQDILKVLTFLVFNAFFGVKFSFIAKYAKIILIYGV